MMVPGRRGPKRQRARGRPRPKNEGRNRKARSKSYKLFKQTKHKQSIALFEQTYALPDAHKCGQCP